MNNYQTSAWHVDCLMMQIKIKPSLLFENMANLEIKKLWIFKADSWVIMKLFRIYLQADEGKLEIKTVAYVTNW